MSAEHDYFGLIDDDGSGGLHWSELLDATEQAVAVDLSAPDADEVTAEGLDSAAAMVRAIDAFDARARDALVAQLSERASATTEYIDRSVDDLGESLLDLIVHNSGDIAVDVLRSLHLVRVALHPERVGDDEVFATFDYSIDPDETDDVLVVSFDIRGDVVDVDIES